MVALSEPWVELASGKFELWELGVLDLNVVWSHVAVSKVARENGGIGFFFVVNYHLFLKSFISRIDARNSTRDSRPHAAQPTSLESWVVLLV